MKERDALKCCFGASKPLLLVTAGLVWLALCQPASANDPPEELPRRRAANLQEPDYDGIAHMAGRVVPGEEYIEVLPKRRADCTEASSPYSHNPTTARMVEGMTIRLVCLEAMLTTLGEIHYSSKTLAREEVQHRFDQLNSEMYGFLWDAYNGTPDCFRSIHIARFCGFMNYELSPRADYLDYLTDLVELMALGTGRVRDVAAWRKAWAEAGRL